MQANRKNPQIFLFRIQNSKFKFKEKPTKARNPKKKRQKKPKGIKQKKKKKKKTKKNNENIEETNEKKIKKMAKKKGKKFPNRRIWKNGRQKTGTKSVRKTKQNFYHNFVPQIRALGFQCLSGLAAHSDASREQVLKLVDMKKLISYLREEKQTFSQIRNARLSSKTKLELNIDDQEIGRVLLDLAIEDTISNLAANSTQHTP